MTKYCVVFHNPKGKAFLVMNEWDDGVYFTSLVGLVILIKLRAILSIRKRNYCLYMNPDQNYTCFNLLDEEVGSKVSHLDPKCYIYI
jgi:hypothetical protein